MPLPANEREELDQITSQLDEWYVRNVSAPNCPPMVRASPNDPPMLRTASALLQLKEARNEFGEDSEAV